MDILIILGLILLNGVFAMSEIAIVSARRGRLQRAADGGDAGAAKALQLSTEPTRFLSTIQVGITLVGILVGAMGEASFVRGLEAWFASHELTRPIATGLAWALMVIMVTYASLILGELVPKRIALINPERIARFVARPMDLLAQGARPLVWLLSVSTELVVRLFRIRPSATDSLIEEEIHTLVRMGAESGELERSEQDLVQNVLRLDDKRVGNIMTLREDLYYLDLEDGDAVNLAKIRDGSHSWLPVCSGGIAKVEGILSAKEVLGACMGTGIADLRTLLHPALQISVDTTVLELLEALRESNAKLAVVLDHQGQTAGLVTMADIMMAIIGDLASADEDYEPDFVAREDGSWLVDGQVDIASLKDKFSLRKLPDEERAGYHSLGGFILSFLDRMPRTGDVFIVQHLRFEVVDMDGNRVDKVLISMADNDAASTSEERSAFSD